MADIKPLLLKDVLEEAETLIRRQLMGMGINPDEPITDPKMREVAEYKMLMAMPRIINHRERICTHPDLVARGEKHMAGREPRDEFPLVVPR